MVLATLMAGCLPAPPTSLPVPTPSPSPSPTPTLAPTATPDFWALRTSTPEEQGIDSAALVALLEHIADSDLDLNSVIVVRNGRLVLEAYFRPRRWGASQPIASVTKSLTSALVGIAIEEGHIESVDQLVLSYFAERDFENDDPRKAAMTIEHLLTMKSGLDWDEFSTPYTSPENDLVRMFRSLDYVQFVLDRPMVAEPGQLFTYSTGVSHVLGAIVEGATGMSLSEYASERLFGPIGVTSAYWEADPAGVDFGGGGLRMAPQDLARFGLLYAQDGRWEGHQIVPEHWIEASVAGASYGYQWWLQGDGNYAALGYPGNRIEVLPDLQMVVVVTGELAGADSRYLVDAYIIPAAVSAEPLSENPEAVEMLGSLIAAAEQ